MKYSLEFKKKIVEEYKAKDKTETKSAFARRKKIGIYTLRDWVSSYGNKNIDDFIEIKTPILNNENNEEKVILNIHSKTVKLSIQQLKQLLEVE